MGVELVREKRTLLRQELDHAPLDQEDDERQQQGRGKAAQRPPDQGQVGSLASTPRRLRWLARCVRAAGLSVESAA